MSLERYRCFIAVEMPRDVLALLGDLQQRLHAAVGRADFSTGALRWVRPEGIHLTLKFLGSVEVARVPMIEGKLRSRLSGTQGCQITIGGLGMFPSASRPKVVWVGVGGDVDRLSDLQREVDLATVPLGFPSEQRAFSPHLTLARVREDVDPATPRALGGIVAALGFEERSTIRVEEISLMRSELRRGGAHYSRLSVVRLTSTSIG